MKLPPTIAETGAFHPQGRQVNSALGRATPSDDRKNFDDVLSNLGAKANGSESTSTGKPATARQATATALASAQGAQEASTPDATSDAPTLLDALLAGSSRPAPEPADPRTSTTAGAASQDDDQMVDSVLKRVSRRGDDAPAGAPAATGPQDPAALLSLVVPAVGAQANDSKSATPPHSAPTAMSAALPDGSDKGASATTQPLGKADAQPLIFDIAVATQLAPANPVSSKSNTGAAPTAPDPAVANSAVKGSPSATLAGALPGAPAAAATDAAREGDLMLDEAHATASPTLRRSATRSADPVTPSNVETAAQPVGDASTGRADTSAGHAQVQERPPPGPSSAIASSPTGQPAQKVIETDPETPRKDEVATSLDGASAASGEMLASATPTLSPPVRQVAAALARLAADASSSSGTVVGADPSTDATKLRPTLARTLTLQMSPAALGTVAVRMHSSGGALDVQLSASDPQTAGLLVRERDALAASLQDQHTTLHSLVIQDGSGAPQPGGQHATQGDTSGAGTRADRQGSDAGSQGDGRQQRQRPDSEQRRENAPGGDRRGSQARPDGDRRSLLV